MSNTSTLIHPLPTDRKQREVHHWVNGRLLTGNSGRFGDVYNPASGELQARVALATVAEVDSAVTAAAAAFPAWSAQPALRRARVLFRFREIFERRLDEVAVLLTSEHGKVFADAKGEATRGLEVVEFATGIPQLLKGEYSEQVGSDRLRLELKDAGINPGVAELHSSLLSRTRCIIFNAELQALAA